MAWKSLLTKSFLYRALRSVYRKFWKISRHPIQDSETLPGFNITFLGSEYGGWSFVDKDTFRDCTILSAGLGEDASFEVEFASKYNAKVIIVDPTPRAIIHFKQICDSLGNPSKRAYSENGSQPVDAYDLSAINKDNLLLVSKALWNKNKRVKFFEPKKPEYVSHSIVNFQNDYSQNTKSIEVDAITVASLLTDLNIDASDIPLMKLDIEGAEIEVIKSCIGAGIMPSQILLEFDELNVPGPKSFARVTDVDKLLKRCGYKLLKTNGQADFLYYK